MDASSNPIGEHVYITFEDRQANFVGVELLVLSLHKHQPAMTVMVAVPLAPSSFRAWIAAQPNARLIELPDLAGQGWNIKPAVLKAALELGVARVTWIDADVIATGPVPADLQLAGPATVVGTEEFYWGQRQGGYHRTRGWRMPHDRHLRKTVNTGIFSVTQQHWQLLASWEALLGSPEYTQAQSRPFHDRQLHVLGDQDVLTALLCSRPYAELPVVQLASGTVIAQCFGPSGFTVRERVFLLRTRRLPAYVHAMGWRKPWNPVTRPALGDPMSTLKWIVAASTRATEPYRLAATAYTGLTVETAEWLRDSRYDAALRTLFGRDLRRSGILFAAVHSGIRAARQWLRLGRYEVAP